MSKYLLSLKKSARSEAFLGRRPTPMKRFDMQAGLIYRTSKGRCTVFSVSINVPKTGISIYLRYRACLKVAEWQQCTAEMEEGTWRFHQNCSGGEWFLRRPCYQVWRVILTFFQKTNSARQMLVVL
jgi:hypothetical protein